MKTDNMSEDRALEERTKLLFNKSVSSLDPQTRSKLTQARYRALEELEGSAPAGWRPRWIPAGVLAAGVLVVVMLWQGQPAVSPETPAFDVAALSDLEIILGDGDLGLLQELEFYAWLDEQAEIVTPESAEGGVG
jgi:hypothetical protein